MKTQGVGKGPMGSDRQPWAGRTLGDVYKMTFSYTLERKKNNSSLFSG